jgi:PAT family beta-lactamase induction signal transducer AmpG
LLPSALCLLTFDLLIVIGTQRFKKLTLLGSLYVSQYISIMFLYQALPVFMRQQGASLEAIGLLHLLILPLVLKFLWSPLIDRYGFTRWGHYRFWIVLFQLLVASTTVFCAFLDIEQNFTVLLFSMFLLCFFCSSQDIATDALAVNLLEPQERGFGNGVQIGGNYLGAVIGGGGMTILLDYWGWQRSLLLLALIMVVALIPILQHQEAINSKQVKSIAKSNLDWLNFLDVFRRQGMSFWLLALALYTAGGSMTSTMFRPLLVDIGLSLEEIGWLLGVVSYSAGMVGALTAGLLINSLGRRRSLLLFGLLKAIAIVTYLLPTSGLTNLALLYLIAIFLHLAIAMAEAAAATLMMDKSEPKTAGRDYTLQTSVVYLGGIGSATISGGIAAASGYQGLFTISAIVTLISIGMISKVRLHKVFTYE